MIASERGDSAAGGKVGLVEMYIHRLRSDSAEIERLFRSGFRNGMAASDRTGIT
jgi:hypothetical protein